MYLDKILKPTPAPANPTLHDWVPRTRGEASERLTEIRKGLCRKRLYEFFKHSWSTQEPDTPLDEHWSIEAMCDHVQWLLEEWAKGKRDPSVRMALQNLLINIPPRCLKSKIISVAAVAWAWLRWPHMTFICLSANPRVAADNARWCLELVQSSWYREWFTPIWSIKVDQDAVSDYALDMPDPADPEKRINLGWRKSRGWGAKITGEGADCIMADDPHDAKEVHSKVKREAVNSEWKAIYNRVRDRRFSIRIGIMQRLHPEDWTWYVLSRASANANAPQWVHVCLPLEYAPRTGCMTAMPVNDNRYDPKGTNTWKDPRITKGEVLIPVRFPPHVIEADRVELGEFGFNAQMNQDPKFPEGGMFARRMWKFFTIAGHAPQGGPRPEGCVSLPPVSLDLKTVDCITLSVDAAFKDHADSDRVGLAVIANKRADRYVLHDATAVMDFLGTLKAIRELVRLYKPSRILVEDKANGSAVMSTLMGEFPGIIAIEPEGGKESRMWACQPTIQGGNVYLLDGAEWLERWVGEFAEAPKGTHDDRVDALTQCLIFFAMDPSVMLAMAACRM